MQKSFKIILLLCAVLSSNLSIAQSLTIERDGSSKAFKENAIYRFKIAKNNLYGQGECSKFDLVGKIHAVHQDSVVMEISYLEEETQLSTFKQKRVFNITQPQQYFSFPKKSNFVFQHYRSSKSKKRRETLTGFGGALIVSGIITSAVALFVDDKDNRNELLIGGASAFGVGIIVSGIGVGKKYRSRDWKIQ